MGTALTVRVRVEGACELHASPAEGAPPGGPAVFPAARPGGLTVLRLGAPGNTASRLRLSVPVQSGTQGLLLRSGVCAVFPGPAPVQVLASAPDHPGAFLPAPWTCPPEPGERSRAEVPGAGERLSREIQASDLVPDVVTSSRQP